MVRLFKSLMNIAQVTGLILFFNFFPVLFCCPINKK